MKPKKNPKTDLNQNRSLFFITGLMLVLTLIYVALEWKTYDDSGIYDTSFNVIDPLDEPVDLIEIKLPSPQKPPVAPEIIEIFPNEPEINETDFKSTETNQEEEIVAIDSIQHIETPVEVDVDWINIEEVPIFPGCEDASDKRACFQKMIINYVRKTQRYPEDALEVGAQGRVSTMFTIQNDGTIADVEMRGPHKSLEREASRIIAKLPKMKPGKQRDIPVKVSFSLPITFRLQ